jgi:DNA-binding IclR family transcriptional regulator
MMRTHGFPARTYDQTVAVENSATVLDKAFDLLDVLAEGEELGAAELADRVGQPRSSVYRSLTSLRRRGWVEAGVERGTFRLGLEFLRFGGVVLGRFDVRDEARPVLERMHAESGQTLYLCVRAQDSAVCIDRIDGMFVGRAALRIGGTLPLHVGAASRLLLAFEPESEWRRYVESGELEQATPKTETSPAKVLRSLAHIRKDGYAISDEDVTLGLASCGAPVFDHRGRIVAAIAISGIRRTLLGKNRAATLELITEGARQISTAMGHGTGFGASAADG